MIVLALLTRIMPLVEQAWLVLPGVSGFGLAVAPLLLAAFLAMVGLGCVGAEALRWPDVAWCETEWVGKARSV